MNELDLIVMLRNANAVLFPVPETNHCLNLCYASLIIKFAVAVFYFCNSQGITYKLSKEVEHLIMVDG